MILLQLFAIIIIVIIMFCNDKLLVELSLFVDSTIKFCPSLVANTAIAATLLGCAKGWGHVSACPGRGGSPMIFPRSCGSGCQFRRNSRAVQTFAICSLFFLSLSLCLSLYVYLSSLSYFEVSAVRDLVSFRIVRPFLFVWCIYSFIS